MTWKILFIMLVVFLLIFPFEIIKKPIVSADCSGVIYWQIQRFSDTWEERLKTLLKQIENQQRLQQCQQPI